MYDAARPASSALRRLAPASPLLLPTVLFSGFLSGCSSEGWEAPPAVTRQDDANVALVNKLTDVMEERQLWALEIEDGAVRVHLDRRESGGGGMPMMVAPGSYAPGGGAANSGSSIAAGGAASSGGAGGGRNTGGTRPAPAKTTDEAGPGAAPVDVFHPDNRLLADGSTPAQPDPLYGGRVIVHLSNLPKHTNYVTENSAVTRRMLYEVHETLAPQDWEYHDYKPRLATGYQVEDMVVLADGAEVRYDDAKPLRVRPLGFEEPFDGHVLYGKVTELADGGWRVEPQTDGGSALESLIELPAGDVMSVELGCVLTYQLRDDALWHPAAGEANGAAYSIADQKMDAADVYFSWALYSNMGVDCDEKRFNFEKVTDCEVLGDHEVRFFYQEQYFSTIHTLGANLTILPSHIYDLSDPDCPWYDPEATEAAQAEHINENPHNQLWIGLGPYRVTDWNQSYVEAQRFDGYFDPDNGGYVDTIRWRYIGDDNSAFQALLNGELDYFERVKSTDYFGAATEKPDFVSQFYKGYKYLGSYGYTGWNTQRPYLSDKRVRQALAHAFPFDDYLITNYKNLARQITGPFPYNSAGYDHSVKPFPHDPERARELLEEAGFFDSDGNGIVDRDGRDLVIEFMMPSGNDASKSLGLVMQESFGEIGVGLEFAALEWATFLDRMKKREFDGCNLAWVPELESDPEQVWHSKWGAPEVEGSNNSGVQEPELDALILAGQREVDFDKRQEIWKAIHRFLYDLQPYLFGYNVPQKFAMSKRIRGFQAFAIDPGYSIRRWYFVDPSEPGTRPNR
ncbi:ABC transporter substrate-binding protein [Engelhardtia mirabilis]|uniref:Oligopeptide-binding protein AppA n=1 Tax=Engelhardtia mirabilis TaxID=2528011 RepID=A0A518BI64_9BACT|nr:Oligopeptide-binding protein AppA precursor [Planctomycetes bacterium Pla133]QDV00981.1 Oligopeptide-binding protein AppA precursor [Planctomycetes bacterium Pla86]